MRDWEHAWQQALYGPRGFFARGERPAEHFRTSPLVGPELAGALLELLGRVDTALGHPPTIDFVDVGAGGGELTAAVRELATRELARRLRVTAVELAPPLPGAGVHWRREIPESVTGLLVGHEWLDAVPCPVVEVHGGRPLRLAVDERGEEQPGEPAGPQELAWLDRWWPLRPVGRQGVQVIADRHESAPGDHSHANPRAEVGRPRDAAWAQAVRKVRAGAALAIDYGHLRAERAAGHYRHGTLTGYRAGRQVRPVPDGSRDLTAHVAMDACAAAAPASDTTLVAQRDALAALGLTEFAPPAAQAATDPHAWLAASARTGRISELRASGGLGGFGWLLHTTGGLSTAALLPDLPAWVPPAR